MRSQVVPGYVLPQKVQVKLLVTSFVVLRSEEILNLSRHFLGKDYV